MKELTDVKLFYGSGTEFFFNEEAKLCLVLKPGLIYRYRSSAGVLKEVICDGYRIEVSSNGQVCFHDYDGRLLACAEGTAGTFEAFCFNWADGLPSVELGAREEVDYYPNCDGEYDRWGSRWFCQRRVILNPLDNAIAVK